MKKTKLTILVGSCLSLVVIGSAFASTASSVSTDKKEIISSSFNELKEKLGQEKSKSSLATPAPLVKGEDFQISKQDFVFYKSNIDMLNKLQGSNKRSIAASPVSDDALIDEMVTKELTVSHAKKLGLQVSPQEVDAVIQNERALLNDPSITGEENEMVREIMKERIKITGLSEDQFWKSNETRKEYEKALLMGKLFDKLVAEEKIKKDGADFSNFQKSLLNDSKGKGKINVNKNALNN